MNNSAKSVCDFLTKHNVEYKAYEHQAVFTVEDVRQAKLNIPGIGTKNLFLKDKPKNRFFLFISEENRRTDLKSIARHINSKRLSFGSPEELADSLGLEPGFVGPIGVINDALNKVIILFDSALQGKKDIHVSANSHTTTLAIDFDELCRFIKIIGNEICIITFNEE